MNRPFYTEFAWAYDLLTHGPVASRVAFIVNQLRRHGIAPGSRLLDAGCGTGSYSIALAELGFKITGIDASSEMIAEAKRKSSDAVGQTSFVVGDILRLPVGLKVDAILCRGVLNDLTADDCRNAVFESFGRALRPRGVLILDVREWQSTVVRKTLDPVFMKVVETDKGRLTFRSVTALQPETRCLRISENHELVSGSSRRSANYDFVMRCWTQGEIIAGLGAAGFESVQCFGDYDTAKPLGSTDRMVAVATMPLATRPNA